MPSGLSRGTSRTRESYAIEGVCGEGVGWAARITLYAQGRADTNLWVNTHPASKQCVYLMR